MIENPALFYKIMQDFFVILILVNIFTKNLKVNIINI